MKVGLMNERPEQPPEGKLLAAATERSGLSIREASRRAGISYGRWRQITSGVQHVSPGEFAAVHAPPKTLAKMAHVVGVTAEQLDAEGRRPDAAAALKEMKQHTSMPLPAHGAALSPPPPGEPFTRENLTVITPVATTILRRLDQVRRDGIRAPSGWQMFPDNSEYAVGWDATRAAGLEPEQAVWFLAVAIVEREQERREEDRRYSGTTGA